MSDDARKTADAWLDYRRRQQEHKAAYVEWIADIVAGLMINGVTSRDITAALIGHEIFVYVRGKPCYVWDTRCPPQS